jgi:hypothetical protein
MASPQQLDVVSPGEIEDTLTKLMTKGLLGGAPTPLEAVGVDPAALAHGVPGTSTAVDGLSGHALADGATIIGGPPEGGALLDRPVGSFLAEHATEQSVELEQFAGEGGVSYLARRVAGAGEMQMLGMDVNLIDFVPGGDVVQMVAGERFDPSSMLLSLAKGRMEAEAVHGHLLDMGREGDREHARADARQSSDPVLGDQPGAGPGGNAVTAGRDVGQRGEEKADALDVEEGEGGGPGGTRATDRLGRPRIDGDTAARDLALVSSEHALDLDNAVSQWDEHDVHTEMTLHGRRLEIDTHYDAHNPDNRKEVETADSHARHIPDAADRETVTEGSRMAFRSQVHAHLEAAARDEGMSR